MTGRELEERRKAAGLTRAEFAALVGTTANTIYAWERKCRDTELETSLRPLSWKALEKALQRLP